MFNLIHKTPKNSKFNHPQKGGSLLSFLGAFLALFLLSAFTPFFISLKLMPTDGAANDVFGTAVAIEKNTLAIGAILDDDKGVDAGAVYVFQRSGSNWIETQKITALDGSSDDRFGRSIDIHGNTMVIGSYFDDDNGPNSGSAYVFQYQRTSMTWTQIAKLTASDGTDSDRFGWSVAIGGDIVVIGAYNDDDACTNNSACDSGAIYVFERNQGGTNSWGQVAKLTASDAALGDNLGRDIAISGNTMIVSAQVCLQCEPGYPATPGKVYVFERYLNTGIWNEVKILIPDDGVVADNFGFSIDIEANLIVIGALGNDSNGTDSGAAYVFERNQGGTNNWGLTKKILANDASLGDHFGFAVSISGNKVSISSPQDNGIGSVYIFNRRLGGLNNWGQEMKLIADDGNIGDEFGSSLSLSGSNLIIGARFNDAQGIDSGAAYGFTFKTTK